MEGASTKELVEMEGPIKENPKILTTPIDNHNTQQEIKQQQIRRMPEATASFSSTSSMRQLRQPRPPPPSHLALPLSMRLIKHVSGLCCIDCANNNSSSNNNDQEEHPDLSILLNYDLQALQCTPVSNNNNSTSKNIVRPSSASPLVLAPMTMPMVVEEPHIDSDNDNDADSNIVEYEQNGEEGAPEDEFFIGDPKETDQNKNDDNGAPQKEQRPSRPLVIEHKNSSSLSSQSSSMNFEQVQQMMMTNPPSANKGLWLPSSSSLSRHHRALSRTPTALVETIVTEYIAACRFYGCGDHLNAGVMTTLRFSLPCLRVAGRFHDADMLALAEVLLKYVNGPLSYIKRLDFSLSGKQAPPRWSGQHTFKGMQSHGAFTLAKVLQMSKHIKEVFLTRNRIGPYGASAIFIACSTNTSITKLVLRRCRVCERGALVFAELVVPSTTTALEEVDLSANYIGIKGSLAIERALLERMQRSQQQQQDGDGDKNSEPPPLHMMTVDLEGNHVLQEVMNAVTHGLGILLAVIGTNLMTRRASTHHDYRHILSCAVYSMSLIVLYTSSTLYHSFFSMQNTKYIFEVFDKCAIYILIAGSYTPFLQIVLGHQPKWSVGLLTFIWMCCCLGIAVEALCPTWEHKLKFSLAMYLGMGWSALICLPQISLAVSQSCIKLMVLGGVAYTSGVPFFVRNNNLDHAVWHLFVLAGSIFHWCGVYFYVVDFTLAEDDDGGSAAMRGFPSSLGLGASNETCFSSVPP